MGSTQCGRAGTMLGDAVWIERARAGDAEAFGVIFHRYGPRIRAHCYGIIGNAADADDLTQETFLRAYRALGTTSETLSLSAWLYRIATNACTDLLRRRRTARWLPWEEGYHERPAGGARGQPGDGPARRRGAARLRHSLRGAAPPAPAGAAAARARRLLAGTDRRAPRPDDARREIAPLPGARRIPRGRRALKRPLPAARTRR